MGNYFLKILFAILMLLLHAEISILGFKWPTESAEVKCNEKEKQSLLNLKHGLYDPSGMLLTWRDDENNTDCCKWRGIECHNETGHVKMLHLRGVPQTQEYLTGEINMTSLIELQNMEYLDLSWNDFSGSQIPKHMGSFSNLRYLNLSYSGFGGRIPSELGNLSKLEYLSLELNFLAEAIPSQLGKLTRLRYLDLSYNFIYGEIPYQLGNLSQLQYLDLGGTSLSGAIPFHSGNLPMLNTLKLVGNDGLTINDAEAEWLSALSFLTNLDLSSIPNLGSSHHRLQTISKLIPNLRELRLVNCGLSDNDIPSLFHSHSNFSTSLTILDLSSNMLTSSTFQLLSNFSLDLQELYLSNNNIILSSPLYLKFPSLVILDLSSSIFQGNFNFSSKLQELGLSNCSLMDRSFPVSSTSIMNFSSSLVSLDLSNNLLKSSAIFHWLSNFTTNLRSLNLPGNMLEGPIPDGFGRVMNSLEVLDLSSNMLTSSTFQLLSNFSLDLQELYLSNNNIILSSPLYLKFPSLVILDLSSSIFQGNFNFSSKLQELGLSNCSLMDRSFPVSSTSIMNFSSSLVSLDLSNNLLKSSAIFHWLSNFTTNLRSLKLPGNMLEGPIPDGFGRVMNSLEVLDLSSNKLQGEIPASFGSICTLQELYLDNNNLRGQISNFIQNSSRCNIFKFQILDLSYNQITGMLPDLSIFSSLRRLDLSNNQLIGEIPESIGLLYKLQSLHLEENYLEGDIIESHFTNLFKLEELDLTDNSLSLKFGTGWVPPFQLYILGLASCKLGPGFPSWLQTQSHLSFLDISHAGINDSVPDWFWSKLQTISELNMSSNSLIGKIPNLPLKLTNVDEVLIFLNSNQFEGGIPAFLSQASILDLSNNKISDLNTFLCGKSATTTMSILDLSSNQIMGQLPDCWEHLNSLQFLDLSSNNLSGKIPQSMGALFKLEALVLRNNYLIGELPSTLKNCTNLVILDVGENLLSSTIPSWIGENLQNLKILSLRVNHFFGSIPPYLCYLSEIHLLDLSRNNLSKGIPTCLKDFTTMMEERTISREIGRQRWVTSKWAYLNTYEINVLLMWKGTEHEYWNPEIFLKSIDLSSNNLIGEIPKEIGYLLGLVSLNLSRNNLSGEIPTEIGNLSSLDFLDLSRNHFSGKIPSTLSKIDRLSVLDLSYNSLTGRIPVGTQLQTFDASQFEGNLDLCGEPLSRSCPEDKTTLKPQRPAVHDEDDDSLFYEALYMSLGIGYFTGFWGLIGPILLWRPWRIAYLRFLIRVTDYIYVMVVLNVAKCHKWLKS